MRHAEGEKVEKRVPVLLKAPVRKALGLPDRLAGNDSFVSGA
jgi:hypothetical protein